MRDLTRDEQKVLDSLGEAWGEYCQLPDVHKSDLPEFVQAIHAAQNIVLARPATEAQAASDREGLEEMRAERDG